MHNFYSPLMSNMVLVPAEPGALRRALQNASANTTIVLSKGVHEESEVLVVEVEGISIISSEKLVVDELASTSIVGRSNVHGGGPLIHIKAKNFCIRDVCLELVSVSEQNTGDCCVLISEESEAVIENCRISAGLKYAGIEVAHYSKPKIVSCDVSHNKM
jgi:hypothetical protein